MINEKDAFAIDNGFNFIVHKRESFSHEREVRAVIWSMASGTEGKFVERPNGLIVPVELGKVIQTVHVGPKASPMVGEVVEGLLKTYGVGVPVLQSEVNAPPPY